MNRENPPPATTNPIPPAEPVRLPQTDVILPNNPTPLPGNSPGGSPEAAHRLLHELRMHKIELEMQNEELRHVLAERDASKARFFDYYEFAPVGYATLSEPGLIREANHTLATLLAVNKGALLEQPLSRFIILEDHGVYAKFRQQLSATGAPQSCELRMQPSNGSRLWIHLAATLTTDDRGAPVLRLVLSDISARKQAEIALRDEKQALRALMENVPDGIYLKDKASRFLRVNPAMVRRLGVRTQAEAIGKTEADFFSAEQAALAIAYELEIMQTGQPLTNIEEKEITPDGSMHWVVSTKLPLRDIDGRIIGTYGISRDITASKQKEEALSKAKQDLEKFFHLVPDLVAVVSPDGYLKSLNRAWEKTLGYTIRDIERNPLASFIHPDDLAATKAKMREHLSEGVTLQFENRFRHKDGSYRWLEWRATPSEGNLWYASANDITERRQSEAALAALALRHQTLLHTASDGIHVLNEQGQVVEANAAFCHLLGYTRDEMLRLNVSDWDARWSREELSVRIRHLLTHPEPLFETRHRRKDGSIRDVEISCVCITLDGQNYLYNSARDITERKRAEEDKARLEIQLRQSQKLEAIGQLAGGIAHDFNNLITAIQGNADLLLDDHTLPQTLQHDLLQQISQASNRASTLTQQLLLFSRREVPVQRALELNHVVAEMVKMLQRLISEHIILQLSYAPQPLSIHADAGMLDQVLLNLVVNAQDAMEEGGKLKISTESITLKVDPETDQLTEWVGPERRHGFERPIREAPSSGDAAASTESHARAGEFACLTVTDEGCGMPPEVRAHIFEPFFTTKEAGRGTGLGLATVYGIVQQHQGWIEVDSHPGKGTSFRIYLPRLLTPLDPKTSVPEIQPSLAGRGETILIVEDELSVRTILRIMLERAGYRVLESASGIAALELWPKHQGEINLLITDMVMPGAIGGVKLAQKLLHEKPDLKIIITSGYSATLSKDRKKFPVVIDFIPKPYEQRAVLAAVRARLDAPQTARK